MAKRKKRAKAVGKKTARPHISARQKKGTKLAKTRFLKAFGETGNITAAARISKIGRRTHYDWLEADPEYVELFKEAEEIAVDALEEEARRRAIEGVDEPVGWYQGQPGGYVRRYSDTLLIFLLKGRKPEMYRERYEHTGKGGGDINFTIKIDDNRNVQ